MEQPNHDKGAAAVGYFFIVLRMIYSDEDIIRMFTRKNVRKILNVLDGKE